MSKEQGVSREQSTAGWRQVVLRGVQPDAQHERHGPVGALRPRRQKHDSSFNRHTGLLAQDTAATRAVAVDVVGASLSASVLGDQSGRL